MLLQKLFDKHTHFCSCEVSLLPVYSTVFPQGIRQFFGDRNQFFILIKILDGLRLGECVIECKFIRRKSQLVSFFLRGGNLLGKVQQFLDNLFICQHTV